MKQIDAKIKKLWNSLDGLDPDKYFAVAAQAEKLENLNKEITVIYNEYAQLANAEQIKVSRIGLSNNYYYSQYSAAWFTPEGIRATVLPFVYLDPISIDLSVFHIQKRFKNLQNMVRKRKLAGMVPKQPNTLLQIMHRNRVHELKKIKDSITQGLIQGKSYNQMANDLKNTFGQSKNNALRVARTEGNSNLNGAQYINAREGNLRDAGIVRQILSTLDSRTRAQSATIDGLREDTDGFFHYPGGILVSYPGNSGIAGWDINDRETTIDIVDGVGPKARRGRNPNTGENEVADYSSFNAWAKTHGLTRNEYGEIVVGKDAKRRAERQAAQAIERGEVNPVQI